MTIPGVVASEWRGSLIAPTFWTDVVFQSTWDGTDGATDAIDESPINAPLTWHGAAESNAQHLADTTCSMRCDTVTDYVSAPANVAYDIGNGDWTFETFIRIPQFGTTTAMQWMGVWQQASIARWRIISDSDQVFFQAFFNSVINNFSFQHAMITNTWYFCAWARYLGILRAWMAPASNPTAPLVLRRIQSSSYLTTPGVNLYIGGNPDTSVMEGSNAFFQHMRLSRKAWYRDDNAIPIPTQRFGFGQIFPRPIAADDVFYAPTVARQGDVTVPKLAADDAFFTTTVVRNPSFVNATTTNGATGATAGAVTLIGSRVNGNLLIAYVAVNGGGKTFAVGGGWTIGAQINDANSSAAWAWRIVDGTEAAPTFSWTGAATWHGKMIQFTDNHASSPIGTVLSATGASANLIVNGGVGLTTTGLVSTVAALTMVHSSSQTIPLPAGYTAAGANFNDANGSDRASFQYQSGSGTVSGPVNLTITSAFWQGFMIEIKRK
jgi:hypothetical protein